jgi:hypothetical protein
MFSTCKQLRFKTVSTLARLKTHSISILEPRTPKICFGKATLGNQPSCIRHQASGFAHLDEIIKSLLNKDNSPMTNAQEDSLIKTLTPNMFFSNFNLVTSIAAIDVMVVRFNQSEHTIKEGTTLTSYLEVNRIAFLHPTKIFTMCKTLKCESNML